MSELKKKKSIVENDTEELINEISETLRAIFDLRFIERISRPISQPQRNKLLDEFKRKFNHLHMIMEKFKSQVELISTQPPPGKNEQKSTNVVKPLDFSYLIKKIERKYKEIFEEGSFKHYDRLSDLYNLPKNMYLIAIEEWSRKCQRLPEKEKRCC